MSAFESAMREWGVLAGLVVIQVVVFRFAYSKLLPTRSEGLSMVAATLTALTVTTVLSSLRLRGTVSPTVIVWPVALFLLLKSPSLSILSAIWGIEVYFMVSWIVDYAGSFEMARLPLFCLFAFSAYHSFRGFRVVPGARNNTRE